MGHEIIHCLTCLALVLGEPIEGRLGPDAEPLPAPAGATLRAAGDWRGVTLKLGPEVAGHLFVTVESDDFDVYVRFEDESGAVLAEDDDGWFGTHARVEAPLAAGQRLVVMAPEGGGRFTVATHAEATAAPTAADALGRAAAHLEVVEERDEEDLRTAHALAAVAIAARAAGDADEAGLHANWAARLYASELDDERRRWEQVAAVYRKVRDAGELVGVMDTARGDAYDAEEYGTAAWLGELVTSCRIAALGEAHALSGRSLHQLALTMDRLDDHERAARLYERALAARAASLGEMHADTAQTAHNLGIVRRELDQLEAAAAAYERALSIRTGVLGEVHVGTAWTLHNLGIVRRRLGQLDASADLLERALRIRTELLGDHHADTAQTIHSFSERINLGLNIITRRKRIQLCPQPFILTLHRLNLQIKRLHPLVQPPNILTHICNRNTHVLRLRGHQNTPEKSPNKKNNESCTNLPYHKTLKH